MISAENRSMTNRARASSSMPRDWIMAWTMGRRSASDGVSVKSSPLGRPACYGARHNLEADMSGRGNEMELAGALLLLGAGGVACALLAAVVFAVL